MRSAFWWALIAGALAAIAAGYLQAVVHTQPPPLAELRAATQTPENTHNVRREPQVQTVRDAFSQDDVVVERARTPQPQWQSERLELVVGICGSSVAAESGFLRLHYPIAFVIDPAAAQARAFADVVRGNGDSLLVQAGEPPSPRTLAAIRREIGPFDGIASRRAAGMAIVLRGTGLTFFDERGDAAKPTTAAAPDTSPSCSSERRRSPSAPVRPSSSSGRCPPRWKRCKPFARRTTCA